MKQFLALLLGCLLMPNSALAQLDFRAGYVIDLSGDTLYGEISYRGDLLMGRECKFRPNNIEEARIYSPPEITAYRFVDSKYFVSREVDGKPVFLEFLINGEVNMYYLRDESGDRYFLDKEENPLAEIPYIEETRERDGVYYEYQSKDHIGMLQYYLRDAPQVKSQIAEIKKPSHNNLVKLAENYHEQVCEDEVCIIYAKMLPALKFNLELTGSLTRYYNYEAGSLGNGQLNPMYYSHMGVFIHFWSPRINEKLYFKTGFALRSLTIEDENFFYVVMPAHIEYIYPKGRIQPRIAYGLNTWIRRTDTQAPGNLALAISTSLEAGANIQLTGPLFLSMVGDVEFAPKYLVIPTKHVISTSIRAGMFVKF